MMIFQYAPGYAIYAHFALAINLHGLILHIRPSFPFGANHVHFVSALNQNSPPKNLMHLPPALASALTRLDWLVILRGD